MWLSTSSGGSSGGAQAQSSGEEVAEQVQQQTVALPSGLLPLVFGINDLPASQTNTQLYRAIPGSAPVMSQQGVQALFPGSIIGIAFRANADIAGGTADFRAYIAGAGTTAKVRWDAGRKGIATFAEGLYPFAAEDELDVRVSTGATFAPTTADVEVLLYISQVAADPL